VAENGGAPQKENRPPPGLKPKDLIGIPWMLAFALRADGWYLRQDIIWHKPNPMPESVRDRCTKAHEYIFLLSKSERYYFDAEAIAEPAINAGKVVTNNNGKNGQMGDFGATRGGFMTPEGVTVKDTRNKRSVWTVTTKPYKGAHFATFPPDLIEPCILAGSRQGDIVLDPFMGSGTTAQVAVQHGRQYLGCELNPAYEAMQQERLTGAQVNLL
jgi:DNA modification methylase